MAYDRKLVGIRAHNLKGNLRSCNISHNIGKRLLLRIRCGKRFRLLRERHGRSRRIRINLTKQDVQFGVRSIVTESKTGGIHHIPALESLEIGIQTVSERHGLHRRQPRNFQRIGIVRSTLLDTEDTRNLHVLVSGLRFVGLDLRSVFLDGLGIERLGLGQSERRIAARRHLEIRELVETAAQGALTLHGSGLTDSADIGIGGLILPVVFESEHIIDRPGVLLREHDGLLVNTDDGRIFDLVVALSELVDRRLGIFRGDGEQVLGHTLQIRSIAGRNIACPLIDRHTALDVTGLRGNLDGIGPR